MSHCHTQHDIPAPPPVEPPSPVELKVPPVKPKAKGKQRGSTRT